MDDTSRNIVTERPCAQCGTPADTGLIFCRKCGAALRQVVPLIPPITQGTDSPNTRGSIRVVLLIFLVCAVFDSVLGYIHERSVPAGVISAVGGLFGTAFYLFLFRVIDSSLKR